MPALRHLVRARAVGAMFDRIAPRYDLLNRLMSLGLDRSWRRLAVELAAPAPGRLVLDAGAGTADLSLDLLRFSHVGRVIGIDLSTAMLVQGKRKVAKARGGRPDLLQADVMDLPFPDGTFDCVVSAFLVRNLAELQPALLELRRVLAPRGRLVILEITRPEPSPAGRLFSLYFRRLVPLLAGAISGDSAAYRYLPASVDRFLSADQLSAALTLAGFEDVRVRRVAPGPVALHVCHKSEPL